MVQLLAARKRARNTRRIQSKTEFPDTHLSVCFLQLGSILNNVLIF